MLFNRCPNIDFPVWGCEKHNYVIDSITGNHKNFTTGGNKLKSHYDFITPLFVN